MGYVDTGSGVPVVFLHPTPLDHGYWLPLSRELSGVRAILPDLRGHGSSELGVNLPVGGFARVPDAPVLTMTQLAHDILALLDHLHLDDAVIAGCSIGGSVALELWRQAPERVRGMTIVCTKPQPDAEANHAKREATIAQVRGGNLNSVFDGMAASLTGATARMRHPEIVRELRARMTLTPEAVVAVQAGLATRPDSVPTVTTITVPLMVVTGGEDPGVTLAEMETYRAAPGGCSFHVIADAGHFAAYEQPEVVAALMTPWLRRFER